MVYNDNRFLIENNTKYHFNEIYKLYNCNINDSFWTDGGYYFFSIKNLNKMYEKIGIFHKGKQYTQYHHAIDGIILGEVGFPSQIFKYFKFTGLDRSLYFNHYN